MSKNLKEDPVEDKALRFKKEQVYRSFAWQKPLKYKKTNLKSAFSLYKESLIFFRQHLWQFSLLSSIFLIIAFVLFLSGSALDLKQAQIELRQRYGDGFQAEISVILALMPEMINVLEQRLSQAIGWFIGLNLFISLSLWWLIRRLQDLKEATKKIEVKDAIYFGPAQIIPFTLIIFTLIIQLLPALIVTDFATQLRTNEVLQGNLEQLGVVLIILSSYALSLYWVVGGIFSLIIVSLPGARPLKAWQTSWHLSHRRRRLILSRLIFLIIFSVFLACILILPALWLIPQWADYLFYLIGLNFFIIGHIYCFLLYQDLLTAKTL